MTLLQSSNDSPYHTTDLLVLPRADLTRRSSSLRQTNASSADNDSRINEKTQNNNGNTSCPQERRNIVLMKLPNTTKNDSNNNNDNNETKLLDRPSHILATSKKATLMMESGTSYKLVTVGTSNTLVVWDPKQSEKKSNHPTNETTTGDEESESTMPDAKRQKTTQDDDDDDGSNSNDDNNKNKNNKNTPTNVQPCQLVVPGGSGASFIICQRQPTLTDDQVLNCLPCQMYDLTNQLLYSAREIQTVLDRLPVIKWDTTQEWQYVGDNEAEVWTCRTAVLQTICEEDYDHIDDTGDTTIRRIEDFDELAMQVQERLKVLLPDTNDDRRVYALAEKFCQLATMQQQKQQWDSKTLHTWVVQDLLWGPSSSRQHIQQQNNATNTEASTSMEWELSELLHTWKTRLPLSFESEVSLETLQDLQLKGVHMEGDLVVVNASVVE